VTEAAWGVSEVEPAAELRSGLERWLTKKSGGGAAVSVGEFSRPKSGYSAETWMFSARPVGDSGETSRFVLRKETPDPAIYPQQAPGLDVEVEIQYRAMRAICDHSSVPIAALIGYESDPAQLGSPFFVMRFVAGQVPVENPPYTRAGFFVDATPAQRRQLITEGLRQLAQLHAIDWLRAGLDYLTPPGVSPGTPRQLDVWEGQVRRELGTRVHPPLERAWAYLRKAIPRDRAIGFCWGDARLGNIIWRDFRPACLTDFEAASIASPDQDLGWWLMFDRWMHEPLGGPRLDGEPTLAEQRALYAEFARIPVPDTRWHEVFAAARYACIAVRVMNRAVARGDLPADQRLWIDNPIVPTLNQLLDEYA
jgi:aminoglycoside phosphotransferase (APT) family kinase protein